MYIKAKRNCKLLLLSLLGLLSFGGINLYAQTAMVTNNYVYYPNGFDQSQATTDLSNFQCTPPEYYAYYPDFPPPNTQSNRSFSTYTLNGSNDPWHNSALIEFDNVFIRPGDQYPYYPNHCLTLCAEVTCTNPARKIETSSSSSTSSGIITYVASGDFPIQSIMFDIFKHLLIQLVELGAAHVVAVVAA